MRALYPYLDHQYKTEQYKDYLRSAETYRLYRTEAVHRLSYARAALLAVGRAMVRVGCQLLGCDVPQVLTAAMESKPV